MDRHAGRPSWQPILTAMALYLLNNLGIISGFLDPAEGHEPTFLYRASDIAQYRTWIGAFKSQVLIPNYHVPWDTTPAFFNPLLWAIARVSSGLDVGVRPVYHAFHFALYVLASFGLFSVLDTFTAGRRQAVLAVFFMVLSLPVTSLLVLPALAARYAGWDVLPPWPGIGDLVWWSSDGFLHGIGGSILVTLGTASSLWVLDRLGRYLASGQRKFVLQAAAIGCVSAFAHPFEIWVMMVGGGAALLFRPAPRMAALRDAVTLCAFGVLGLLPLATLSLLNSWLWEAAEVNRWPAPDPWRLLMVLGFPAILTIVLLARRAERLSGTDLLLQYWFVGTLVCFYLPFTHWQHMLNCFHCVVGILLARLVSMPSGSALFRGRNSRLVWGGVRVWCLLSATALVTYYWQSLEDGPRAQPEVLMGTVAPRDELRAIAWFRENARGDQVVLAPREHAPWFATVPMRSVASHWVFSLTYDEQARLRDAFFAGALTTERVRRMWREYQVRYVVVEAGSGAGKYLRERRAVNRFGSLLVYDLEAATSHGKRGG